VECAPAFHADVGCCLAVAVLGCLHLSFVLRGVVGLAVIAGSIIAIAELGASANGGPWFGVVGSAAAIVVSNAASFD
jgi:hypothetical protein